MSKAYLTIVLRKTCDNPEQAQAIYQGVKQRLADKPDIDVKGQVTNHCEETE